MVDDKKKIADDDLFVRYGDEIKITHVRRFARLY
jgi:hypothetical protein